MDRTKLAQACEIAARYMEGSLTLKSGLELPYTAQEFRDLAKSLGGLSREGVLALANEVFQEMKSENFCGCYEGDLGDNYPEGATEFVKKLAEKLEKEGVK